MSEILENGAIESANNDSQIGISEEQAAILLAERQAALEAYNAELLAFSTFYAADNAESDRSITPDYVKRERANNKAVISVNVNGYRRAFIQVTREYKADKDETRLSVRLITYDAGTKTVNVKKSLVKVTSGDATWHDGDSTTAIGGIFRNRQAMTPAESQAWESAAKKVHNMDAWGTSALRDYLERAKAAKNGLIVLESKLGE